MDALKLDSKTFNEIYDREKPGLNDEIIFSCLLGVRAQKGATIAVGLGFKKYTIDFISNNFPLILKF